MPELNPRRRPPNVLARISVAVLSGAAAMYCLQNLEGLRGWRPVLVSRPLPGLSADGQRLKPDLPWPPASVDPRPAPGLRVEKLGPAKVRVVDSMLLAPEPGTAPDVGMARVAADEAERRPPEPAQAPAPKPEAPAPAPAPHLVSGNSPAVGFSHGFRDVQFKPMSFARKASPAPQAPAVAPAAAPAVKRRPLLFDKPLVDEQSIVSTANPGPAPAEKPFWSETRNRKAAASGAIALAGLIYLLAATGYLTPLFGGRRSEQEKGSWGTGRGRS